MKRKTYRKCLDQALKRAEMGDSKAKRLLLTLKQYKPLKEYQTEDTFILRSGDVIDSNGNINAQ